MLIVTLVERSIDMKKKVLTLFVKFGSFVSTLAFALVTVTANSTCNWYVYQEEMPKQAKKLRKF